MLHKAERFFLRTSRLIGRIMAIVFLMMMVNIFYDVIMRYFFHNSSVAMQELEWHLFSVFILFGVPVALLEEGHVRWHPPGNGLLAADDAVFRHACDHGDTHHHAAPSFMRASPSTRTLVHSSCITPPHCR